MVVAQGGRMSTSTMQQLGRARNLRLSLFASLGLLPLACGGTTDRTHDAGAGTSSGGSSTGGHSSDGGKLSMGGGNVVGGSQNVAGGTTAVRCTSPDLDPATGLVSCDEGYVH